MLSRLDPYRLVSRARLRDLLAMLKPGSRPNLRTLRQIADAIDPLTFNIKQMGYGLARELAAALPPPGETRARRMNLPNGLATQAALESDWAAHWCNELRVPVMFHRKLWELCFALQSMHDADCLRPGVRGLGFGCGGEALPSYLAAQGVSVTATDLPPEHASRRGWVKHGQHAASPDRMFMDHLVRRELFDAHVRLRFVDMNIIPADLADYDFCWSICALEHLGSIGHGLDFIENSLGPLRPGGVAIHTTEYNIRDDGPTIERGPSVAFQRRHLESLADRLRRQGHHVAPFDFSLGDGPLDRFVDLPPYHHELPPHIGDWLGASAHLKMAFGGIVATCVGLVITKRGG